jgi:sugar lactone lactonase YvrE
MPSKAFKLAEAMVSNPVMSDMVENPTATPTQISAVETKTSAISDTGVISVNTKNIVSNNVLTQSFDSNQVVGFNLTDSINAVSPIVSVFKEVPQAGFSSKGQWDVNANATNYEFFDEKPISYSSANLTPSATGDGTFTNSAANTTYYDVANATYDNVSNAQYTQANGAYSTIFNNNGTKAYATAHNSSGDIYQYSLSTAYDVSTNTYDNKTYSFSQFTYPTASRFNGDGTKLYTVAWNGSASSSRIWQYSLSTAYDISTASYDSVNLNLTAHNFAWGFTFNNDGSKVFVSIVDGGATGGRIAEYSLSTNYDLSTAGSQTLYVLSGTGWANYGIEFNNDGTKLFVNNNDDAPTKGPHIFTLSTAYDISTVSYTNTSADVTTLFGGTTGAADITFNNNGSKMYISDSFNGYVRQFSVSTSTAFNEADVGKKVVGNSGSAIITATSGTYQSVTAFADTSAISSWQLFGAEGKADGSGIQLSGFSNAYNLTIASYDNKSYATSLTSAAGVAFSSDGTKMYLNAFNTASDQSTNQHIWQYSLSTAWDVTTASYDNVSLNTSAQNTRQRDLRFKPDGTVLYMVGSTPDGVWQYNLSTAWDLSTASYSNKTISVGSQDTNPAGLALSPDGTKVYVGGYSSKIIFQYNLSTAWDLNTSSYSNNSYNRALSSDPESTAAIESIEINSSGTKLYIAVSASPSDVVIEYDLPSDGNISNISYSDHYSQWTTLGGSGVDLKGIAFSSSGHKFYTFGVPDCKVYEFSAGSTYMPYSTYSPALTNSSTGQINSSSWQDINSMTADETKNGGDIFYAVSTDNRTSWGVAKASDGVRKIAKNNSGTWQYNNDAGTSTSTYYNLSNVSYDNKKYVATQLSDPEGIAFKSDGTAMYITGYGNNTVYQYTLSTAWDVSTASYANKSLSVASQNAAARDIRFKPDGTIMYIVGSSSPDSVYQYNLSTAWDVSTASYANKSINVSSQDTNPAGLALSPDGTKVYICGYWSKTIFQYNLSTAWDLSTSSYSNNSLSLVNDFNYSLNSISINPTGTKIYISNDAGYTSNDMVAEYNLPSDGDISNLTHVTNHDFTGLVFTQNVLVGSTRLSGIFFSSAGDKFYSVGNVVTNSTGGNEATVQQFSAGGTTIGYGTSETWVNGTNNNEHATLQEALGAQAFNRMDKAQLDAVADGYHFSQDSADTLDLMIAPYAASGSSPISDGVTINYNVEALVREAIPGTDYVAEFPNSSTINIKSLVNANIKVRAL